MTNIIRAKMRALHVTTHYSGEHDVELQPVAGDDDPENKSFWEASPSGKCTLRYRKGFEVPFKPGDYYYVDAEPLEHYVPREDDGDDVKPGELWMLDEVTASANNQGSVSLSRVLAHPLPDPEPHGWGCKLRIDIARIQVVELFGRPGTRVRIRFAFAEKHDDEK